MNRDELIAEVKEEYGKIASDASRQRVYQSTAALTPEAYYEKVLGDVISEIERGVFDDCSSGREVVQRVQQGQDFL